MQRESVGLNAIVRINGEGREKTSPRNRNISVRLFQRGHGRANIWIGMFGQCIHLID